MVFFFTSTSQNGVPIALMVLAHRRRLPVVLIMFLYEARASAPYRNMHHQHNSDAILT